ncbi:MAG: helix-turn-helix domain-containing protein [Gammaproteobacteria bacterium]
MPGLSAKIFDIRVDSAEFAVLRPNGSWALAVDCPRYAYLYSLRGTDARLWFDKAESQLIASGSVISFPHGHRHRWQGSAQRSPRSARDFGFASLDRLAAIDLSSPGPRLIAVRIPVVVNPLPDVLAPLIHVPPQEGETNRRLQHVLDLAILDHGAPATIRPPLLWRLAEMLAIELTEYALRRGAPYWQSRVVDPRIRRAVAAMHARPERPWTLNSLAREAGMSRAAFAVRFRAIVGDTPHSYLTRLRMQVAGSLLREQNAPLAEIATRVGYASEAAFSKAFRRVMGTPASQYRRADLERDEWTRDRDDGASD